MKLQSFSIIVSQKDKVFSSATWCFHKPNGNLSRRQNLNCHTMYSSPRTWVTYDERDEVKWAKWFYCSGASTNCVCEVAHITYRSLRSWSKIKTAHKIIQIYSALWIHFSRQQQHTYTIRISKWKHTVSVLSMAFGKIECSGCCFTCVGPDS